MSDYLHPFRTRVFLPKYFFDFMFYEGDINPKPDAQLFLSQASTSQVLEIICLLYPHITFSDEAEDDDSFLRKLFLQIVVPHLSTLIIPKALGPNQHYLDALIDVSVIGSPSFQIPISPETLIDSSHNFRFSCLILCYLKKGQHRLAADNLTEFVKTHKYLNDDEISTIAATYEEVQEGLQESVNAIQSSHHEIEAIGLQLSDSEISQSHRQNLQLSLRPVNAKLQSSQKTFDAIVQDVGFLKALLEYHEKLASKNGASPPESS